MKASSCAKGLTQQCCVLHHLEVAYIAMRGRVRRTRKDSVSAVLVITAMTTDTQYDGPQDTFSVSRAGRLE